jgi:hypothetical protein
MLTQPTIWQFSPERSEMTQCNDFDADKQSEAVLKRRLREFDRQRPALHAGFSTPCGTNPWMPPQSSKAPRRREHPDILRVQEIRGHSRWVGTFFLDSI